jgi:hypothetical protein
LVKKFGLYFSNLFFTWKWILERVFKFFSEFALGKICKTRSKLLIQRQNWNIRVWGGRVRGGEDNFPKQVILQRPSPNVQTNRRNTKPKQRKNSLNFRNSKKYTPIKPRNLPCDLKSKNWKQKQKKRFKPTSTTRRTKDVIILIVIQLTILGKNVF